MSTSANLLAAAERIAALLAGRSAEIEATRHLPADIAKAMARAGLYHMLTPQVCGGHELDVASYFAIVERLARADASAAWCCFVACTSCIVAAYLPADEAQAIFARADLKAAGVFAPRGVATREGDGEGDSEGKGYRVSGRWAWGSGAHNADILVAGCRVAGDDSGAVLSVVLDRAQVALLDNWDSVGLRGSGSGEFEVHDAFVPRARTALMLSGAALARPLYRFPLFGLLAISIAAVSSGIARLAIDALVELAADKTPQGSRRSLAQRAATQEAVARAEASWRSARAFMMQAVHDAWQAAQEDAPLPVNVRRDLRLAATHLVHSSAAVVDRMYTLAGGSAVFASSPLQRCLRDVHVATQHMMVGEATWELSGRLLLGLPTATEML